MPSAEPLTRRLWKVTWPASTLARVSPTRIGSPPTPPCAAATVEPPDIFGSPPPALDSAPDSALVPLPTPAVAVMDAVMGARCNTRASTESGSAAEPAPRTVLLKASFTARVKRPTTGSQVSCPPVGCCSTTRPAGWAGMMATGGERMGATVMRPPLAALTSSAGPPLGDSRENLIRKAGSA